MAKRGPKPKQFCPKGHDTFICGRDKESGCRDCKKEYQHNKNKVIIPRIRFCPKGHDKDIVGIDSAGHCRECVRQFHRNRIEKRKVYLEKNKERIKIRNKLWREANLERILIQNNNYHKTHLEVGRRATLKMKIKRKSRIPNFGQKGIEEFYASKGVGMTVDHIIPLVGESVSGLHVSWNLQYLPLLENINKGNKINLLEASLQYGNILKKLGLK